MGFTRWRYEILLMAMLGFLLFRLGKNFFYDSWWLTPPAAMWGVESYIAAAFWFVLWCFVLLWLFTRGLRGLKQAIDRLAENWTGAAAASGVWRSWRTIAAGPSSSGGTWSCCKATWKDCGERCRI